MQQVIKSLFKKQDMTNGRPLAVIVRFSIPLLIANIAQLLYNTTNSLIVGNLISSQALASVGVCTPLWNLFFTFFMTVGTGVSVVVAQYFGANNKEQLSRSISTSIVLALIATVTIAVLGIPLSGPLLHLIKVNEEIFGWSHRYLMIMFAGAIGLGFFNVLSGILRGLGDSISPLIILLGTSVLNIGLVFLFVGVFQLGVAGAAIATVISQTLSAIFCLIRLLRMRDITGFTLKAVKLYRDVVGYILKVGVPPGIQQVVLTTSEALIQFLVNGIIVFTAAGVPNQTIFISAHAMFVTVNSMATLPTQALNLGSSTFAGQNIGAGRFDRVNRSFISLMITSVAIATVMFAVIRLWGGSILTLFIDMGEANAGEIIAWGVKIQRIMVWCYYGSLLISVPAGIMRGAGNTLPVMFIALFCTVGLRMPMAYIWVRSGVSEAMPGGNYVGLFASMAICTAIAGVMTFIYYISGRWKRSIAVKT